VIFQELEDGFCILFDYGKRVRARAIVVATGVQYPRLPLERLTDFAVTSISYAATEIEALLQGHRCRDHWGSNSAGLACHVSKPRGKVRAIDRARPIMSRIFAAGDVRAGSVKRVASSVEEGRSCSRRYESWRQIRIAAATDLRVG
jgi:thioredoxin reductase